MKKIKDLYFRNKLRYLSHVSLAVLGALPCHLVEDSEV